MGEPVRIADVAARLAEQAPRKVEIVYTGLRPGEKMHEELFADGEKDLRAAASADLPCERAAPQPGPGPGGRSGDGSRETPSGNCPN